MSHKTSLSKNASIDEKYDDDDIRFKFNIKVPVSMPNSQLSPPHSIQGQELYKLQGVLSLRLLLL